MSNKRRRHRVKDLEQSAYLKAAHQLAELMGCTCGRNRVVETRGKAHTVTRHDDACPMRHAGTIWYALVPRREP